MAEFTVEQDKQRMVVRCYGLHEGGVIMKLPSRKWLQTKGVFIVPMTRLNMKALLEAIQAKKIQAPPEIVTLAKKIGDPKLGDRNFPAWFSFKTVPFKTQREAITKIYQNDTGALFMKMGTGKSKTAIDILTAHYYEKRIEVVAAIMPLSVTPVWGGPEGELAKHSATPFEYMYATDKFDIGKIKLKQDKLLWVLVGIESLSQGRMHERLQPLFERYKVGILVDEASRIKNHKAIRTQHAKELGNMAPIKVIATGTPALRNLMDLYSLFEFLDPNIIGAGDYYAFRNRYAIMGGYKNKEIVGYDNTDELMRLIEPFTYTCGKPEGMPPQLWTQRYVELTDQQKEIYRKVKKATLEGVTLKNTLSRALRLQQVVGGFYSLDGIKKVNELTGKIRTTKGEEIHFLPGDKNPKIIELHKMAEDEFDGDSPVIIWARFIKEIDDIEAAMRDHGRVARFTGGIEPEERIRIKDRFQNGEYDFLVGNTQIGGLGLTLTRSHTMVYYSNTDHGEDRLQSEDRIHRTGQTESCLYIDLLAQNTVDIPIFHAMTEKKDLDVYVREQIIAAGIKTDADAVDFIEKLLGDV